MPLLGENNVGFYITTPLYYVNDAPHIGHAYTTVAADVISRYRRLKGDDVHFLTGTDEHGQKVMRAAHKRGMTPQDHVDDLVQRFQSLWVRLDISNDDFIRTTEARHTEVVQDILQDCFDRGLLYKKGYAGWYSTSEEVFYTEKDVVDGPGDTKLSPTTGLPVEWVEEENWFFKMSDYADRLRTWVADNPDWLKPESRRNELLGILKKEVGDLCISRPKTRLPWGIPLPFDDDYVTYVWFDALINYISAVGFKRDDATFGHRWPADWQLLGKDILTTHTLYWGTMLFACGLEPAKRLYAHGWWTVEGQKMSKSLGNVVDPNLLIDAYGSDSVRYVLMAEKSFGQDGDFNHKSTMLRYNADLANKIGNLAHRALSMTEKWLGGVVPALDAANEDDTALAQTVAQCVQNYDLALEEMETHVSLGALVEIAAAGNTYLDRQAPWALNKAGDTARLAGVMRRTLEICRVCAVLLSPFCPNKAGELLRRLGAEASFEEVAHLDRLVEGGPLVHADPLFPRMIELPAQIQAALATVGGDLKSLPSDGAKKKSKKGKKKAPKEPISFGDFSKLELKTGVVRSAAKHPDADKLLVVQVDVGEDADRQIVAGVANRYTPDELVGQAVIVVTNLEPAQIRGVESRGMLLAAGAKAVLGMATVSAEVPVGTVVR